MRQRWLLIAGIVLVALGVGGFFLKSNLVPAQAGIQIETNPQATVFIDGKEIGITPLETQRKPGEMTLRLVPIATGEPLAPWSTKLTLVQGVQTVVRRDFGSTESQSSGDVLSFEKIPGNQSALTIVSSPDASEVRVDGEIRGFTPTRIDSLPVGSHQITISQPGFAPREVQARTESGYRLTIVAMLAQLEQEKDEATEEASLPEEVDLGDCTVQVLNGSGVPGEAGRVKVLLEEEGFTGIAAGNAASFNYENTEVRLKDKVSRAVFETIEDVLTDYSIAEGEPLADGSDYDVVVMVGERKE